MKHLEGNKEILQLNNAISVLRNQYMDGTVSEMTSTPSPMQGNKLVMTIMLINISGVSASFNFRVQGSYDGSAWINLGNGKDMTVFGYDSEHISNVDVAFVRVRVRNTTGTTPKALFDLSFALSQQ